MKIILVIATLILATLLLFQPAPKLTPFNSIYPIESSVPLWLQAAPDPTQPLFQVSCTATSINEKKHYWLTAAHCIVDPSYTYRLNGSRLQAIVLNTIDDVAIFHTYDFSVPAVPRASYPPPRGYHLSDSRCRVSVTGYPFGWTQQTTVMGTVAATSVIIGHMPGWDRPFTIFQLVGGPGMSGSAVLNQQQEIVSVVQFAWGMVVSPLLGGVDFKVLQQYWWFWNEE